MRKLLVLLSLVVIFLSLGGVCLAQDPVAGEKKVWTEEFNKFIPRDKIIGVEQFKKVWEEVLAGKRKAYLLDVRSHPEFYAFHIEGSDHIHAGHVYTIPKRIPDPNTEIYVFCRTNHRANYVTGFLYKYGYKNVYMFDGGVVGWAKAGLPFVNQFVGRFQITEYSQEFKEDGKYRVREFHPY
ncbi:MAG TPA: rhodanese-like domain-containing protein [Thermodesulfobacteriota bacterium]|nr:rhodanese-like domain-containing protein [Thermodesulfobacteriota bacterium]